jgi:hypothetical protein
MDLLGLPDLRQGSRSLKLKRKVLESEEEWGSAEEQERPKCAEKYLPISENRAEPSRAADSLRT